jgi:hypothetical protein
MKRVLVVLAVVALLVLGVKVQAQSEGQHQFTLSWQANTTINTTFSIHSLLTFDGQAAESSVCGQSPEGYNVWCGEVMHYASDPSQDPFDFNFPSFLLPGCSESGVPQSTTVYTSASRRTITEVQSFSCTDSNSNNWAVQTTTATNEYRSWCRFRYCWFSLPQGQQVPITGTLTQAVQ